MGPCKGIHLNATIEKPVVSVCHLQDDDDNLQALQKYMLFSPHKNLMKPCQLHLRKRHKWSTFFARCHIAGKNINQFKPENQFHYKTKIIFGEKRKLEDPVEFSQLTLETKGYFPHTL